jgi:LAO/AO transport system kinase
VLTTVAVQGTGVAELADALDRHHASLAASGGLAARRRQRLVARTRAVLERGLRRWLAEAAPVEDLLARRLDDVAAGRRSPYDVAAEILGQLKTGASR